jgi:uncharacterized membrane protein YtjA (UPF0391 family)
MLYWALVFFVIAIIAGFLGFGGIAFAAAGIAKILFYLPGRLRRDAADGPDGQKKPTNLARSEKSSNQFTICSDSAQLSFPRKERVKKSRSDLRPANVPSSSRRKPGPNSPPLRRSRPVAIPHLFLNGSSVADRWTPAFRRGDGKLGSSRIFQRG